MPRGITEEDVILAADELLARGERPTIERVRMELGRGSPNTINRHMDTWWEGLSGRIKRREGEGLPPPLLELVTRLYKGVNQHAQEEARLIVQTGEDRLEAATAKLERYRKDLDLEKAGVLAANEQLLAEVTSLRARSEGLVIDQSRLSTEIERLTTQLSDLRTLNDNLQKELRLQTDRAVGAEARAQASEQERARSANRHVADIKRIQETQQRVERDLSKQLEQEKTKTRKLKADREQMANEHGRSLSELEKQLSAAEREQTRLATDLATGRQTLLERDYSLARCEQEIRTLSESLNREAADRREVETRSKADAAQMTKTANRLKQERDDAMRAAARLEGKLSQAQKQLENVRTMQTFTGNPSSDQGTSES